MRRNRNHAPFSTAEINMLDLYNVMCWDLPPHSRIGDTFRVRDSQGNEWHVTRGFPETWSEILRGPPQAAATFSRLWLDDTLRMLKESQ
jgi:hypothetical protein